MRFSEQWLREFVDTPESAQSIADRLTMAGLEVEALEPVAPPFSGVVVARLVDVQPHPGADRLRVCRVDDGSGSLVQVVCGAPNAREGLVVPFARVGAQLPGLAISKAKLRGVESFGMLCSARELGLSDDASGLLELPTNHTVGADVRTVLALDDHVFTLKLTPNRSDCLGVYGVAREVAAITGGSLGALERPVAPVTLSDVLRVSVLAPELCGRFSGRIIRGVDPHAATPDWMRARLERAGQRSISALVDISNYVMLEQNRPNHVFDLDKVTGGLTVRWAQNGERLLLLNGQEISLSGDVGVIASDSGVESLAGIMGGEETAVSLSTRDVYVEAAFWWPQAIAGRARRYGFTSDAGHRFERGVDYADTVDGVERVSQLILEICGGQAGPVDDQVLNLPTRPVVKLRGDRVRRVLGVSIDSSEIERCIRLLASDFSKEDDVFTIQPPSYRFDLAIEEDLIEEVARLYGYDNIPSVSPGTINSMLPSGESTRAVAAVRHLLVSRGYQEVVTYSFVDPSWERDFCANAAPVTLENPIASHLAVMRSSLLGGLVNTLANNLRRQSERARLFEVGRCFFGEVNGEGGEFRQPMRIGGLLWGDAVEAQWGESGRGVDFFDAKGDLEALLLPYAATFERTNHPALHPGRAASIVVHEAAVGVVGELHPQWVQRYELMRAPMVFELDLQPLLETLKPQFAGVSRFPVVVRDLAILLPDAVPAAAVLAALRGAAGGCVRGVTLFDVYRGRGVPQGEKSLAFRIVMQDTEKTLSEGEADNTVAVMLDHVVKRCDARLRQ